MAHRSALDCDWCGAKDKGVLLMSESEPIKPPPRRCKRLLMTADALLESFKRMDGSEVITATGLPADARIVGSTAVYQCGWDTQPNIFVLLIESAEFPPVREGDTYPEMTLEFHTEKR